jgi:DNA-directed RNA polymerase subunit M/transcription elongation factor TFIIS
MEPKTAPRAAAQTPLDLMRKGYREQILPDVYAEALRGDGWVAAGSSIDPAPILAFEEELFQAAAAGIPVGRRNQSDPQAAGAAYGQKMLKARKLLKRPWTDFPDETLAYMLWAGRVAAVDAARSESLELAGSEALDHRAVCRSMFLRTLLAHPLLGSDRNKALAHAQQIESACYNQALAITRLTDTRRQWDCEVFVSIYSARCGTVNVHLDPRSTVSAAYDSAEALLQSLWDGELKPKTLGTMEATELCPEATKKERELIALRSQQAVVQKASGIFRCPFCKERRCSYETVQRRALDESADFDCVCLNPMCGRTFKVRGG